MKLALWLVAVVAVVALGAATWLGVTRIHAAAPPVHVAVAAPATWIPAPGPAPVVPTPAQGSIAVDGVAGGSPVHLATAAADAVRPIASVAKAMTALVVLESRPLSGADPGPVITINQADVDDYLRIAGQDGSVVAVTRGERFTERDLLLGLMLPSANNLALTAARWLDGSVDAFVSHLNARAAQLGMLHTHFADPDGLDARTTSTAADLVLLGEAVVDNPQLVTVVSALTATMPDGTVVTNLDQSLGSVPGWIGVKTGWTPQAGGCLLYAARRPAPPGLPTVTVVGAILGQPPDPAVDARHPELGGAVGSAQASVAAAFAGYTWVTMGRPTLPVTGQLSTDWGPSSRLIVGGAPLSVLVHLGDSFTLTVTSLPPAPTPPVPASAPAANLLVTGQGTTIGSWPLVTERAVDDASIWWRLTHG